MSVWIPRRTGFTLIEILVVILLVAIVMGVVVNSFTGADREQTLRGYAERLTLRIEMARDKSLQANREWGVTIDREGVRFAEFDEINGEWLAHAEKPFKPDKHETQVRFSVEVEEYAGAMDDLALNPNTNLNANNEEEIPTIVLFSSGETTPFEITLEPIDWQTRPWILASDGFTRTKLTRGELR